MIYLSPGNKWSIPTILDEIKNRSFIEFLYRDKLGRIQKGKHRRTLMFKTIFRCGTKCTHCSTEGLHFGLCSNNFLRIITNDGFLNVEHIIPQSKGGTDIDYNITIFCDVCNSAKGNKLLVPKKVKRNVKAKAKAKAKKAKTVVKDPLLTIHFGKFVKDLLLKLYDDSHSSMHYTFAELYKSNVSFKINPIDLDSNIETLNYFLCKKAINIVVKREDIIGKSYGS